MEGLQQKVGEIMCANQRQHGVFRYTVPASRSYPYQWFWDSCFHTIIYTHFDIAAAKDELRSLIAHQYKTGLIGHVTYWEEHHVLPVDWGLPHTSSLVQPPLIAYALWRVFEKERDTAFLEELYTPLKRYYQYLLKERDVRGVHLIGLVNPDESGEDNSPRYDDLLELSPHHHPKSHYVERSALFGVHRDCNFNADCTSRSFWVEDVPFNSFLVWNLTIMSAIAHQLGNHKDSNRFNSAAITIKEAMRTHMFQNGRYWCLQGREGIPIEEGTLARFMPLIAGLYSQQEANILIREELLNPDKYWLPYGVPTTAQSDSAFDPHEPTWGEAWQHPTWRGPIWMSMHWFLYHGLTKYGFVAEAAELKEKSIDLLEKSGFREYHNPLTGAGEGAYDFTWGGLVLDMQ